MRPVTVMEQVPPADRVQVEGEKATEPESPVWEKVMVSPEIDPVAPDTVAVQDEVAPTAKEVGMHETDAVVTVKIAMLKIDGVSDDPGVTVSENPLNDTLAVSA